MPLPTLTSFSPLRIRSAETPPKTHTPPTPGREMTREERKQARRRNGGGMDSMSAYVGKRMTFTLPTAQGPRCSATPTHPSRASQSDKVSSEAITVSSLPVVHHQPQPRLASSLGQAKAEKSQICEPSTSNALTTRGGSEIRDSVVSKPHLKRSIKRKAHLSGDRLAKDHEAELSTASTHSIHLNRCARSTSKSDPPSGVNSKKNSRKVNTTHRTTSSGKEVKAATSLTKASETCCRSPDEHIQASEAHRSSSSSEPHPVQPKAYTGSKACAAVHTLPSTARDASHMISSNTTTPAPVAGGTDTNRKKQKTLALDQDHVDLSHENSSPAFHAVGPSNPTLETHPENPLPTTQPYASRENLQELLGTLHAPFNKAAALPLIDNVSAKKRSLSMTTHQDAGPSISQASYHEDVSDSSIISPVAYAKALSKNAIPARKRPISSHMDTDFNIPSGSRAVSLQYPMITHSTTNSCEPSQRNVKDSAEQSGLLKSLGNKVPLTLSSQPRQNKARKDGGAKSKQNQTLPSAGSTRQTLRANDEHYAAAVHHQIGDGACYPLAQDPSQPSRSTCDVNRNESGRTKKAKHTSHPLHDNGRPPIEQDSMDQLISINQPPHTDSISLSTKELESIDGSRTWSALNTNAPQPTGLKKLAHTIFTPAKPCASRNLNVVCAAPIPRREEERSDAPPVSGPSNLMAMKDSAPLDELYIVADRFADGNDPEAWETELPGDRLKLLSKIRNQLNPPDIIWISINKLLQDELENLDSPNVTIGHSAVSQDVEAERHRLRDVHDRFKLHMMEYSRQLIKHGLLKMKLQRLMEAEKETTVRKSTEGQLPQSESTHQAPLEKREQRPLSLSGSVGGVGYTGKGATNSKKPIKKTKTATSSNVENVKDSQSNKRPAKNTKGAKPTKKSSRSTRKH